MADQPQTPIVVNATPTKDQVAAGIRQLALAVLPLATAAGMTQTVGVLNTIVAVSGAVATVVVFVWGQLNTRTKSKQAAVIAAAAPNKVAVVK